MWETRTFFGGLGERRKFSQDRDMGNLGMGVDSVIQYKEKCRKNYNWGEWKNRKELTKRTVKTNIMRR